jgi:GLPGLI family protein
MTMSKTLLAFFTLGTTMVATAQKVFVEGIVEYKITVVSKGDVPGVADAFADATQTLMVKGYKARVDFKSSLRNQTTVHDTQSGNGFVLRQSGNDKYLIQLDQNTWKQYNKRFDGTKFNITNEQKTVIGYMTTKAVGKLPDGSEVIAYFAPDLTVMAKGFDLTFADLPGLPLEFEVKYSGVVLRYEATELRQTMVSASSFDMPKSGYKVLEYKQ